MLMSTDWSSSIISSSCNLVGVGYWMSYCFKSSSSVGALSWIFTSSESRTCSSAEDCGERDLSSVGLVRPRI